MSPDVMPIIISAIGVVMSLVGSAYISGIRHGNVAARLDNVETTLHTMATKDQLASVKEDVAEIKGMFRMTLRDGS